MCKLTDEEHREVYRLWRRSSLEEMADSLEAWIARSERQLKLAREVLAEGESGNE